MTATPVGLFLEEVQNVSPSVLQVNLSSSVIDEGDAVTLAGSFFDPGIEDSHRLSIDWGDGTPVTELFLPPSSSANPPSVQRMNPMPFPPFLCFRSAKTGYVRIRVTLSPFCASGAWPAGLV